MATIEITTTVLTNVGGPKTHSSGRESAYRLVRAFLSQCEAEFGSTNCEQLIGCRLDTPEGQRFFKEHNLQVKCAGFAREAARMAARLLDESDPSVTRQ